ncbi:hypothetical protein D8674_007507 [Pyrus ussuriensis x Pyrus communis]|uniref:Uncharacterized protein n=1 Tax=Pyrus ussuriensis x Pyrus communis TaxID=2448454 RepID=A0A5N5HQW1_9ROSA|nr:hypothetical protein D8674_007507 [Pyrus ussuriensis x Pyrus communis]
MDATYPASTITHPPPPPPPETPTFDEDDEYGLPKRTDWLSKLVSLQADLIYNCFSTLSTSIFSLLSAASESYHQARGSRATSGDDESEDVQDLLRIWQRSRSKRKAIYLQPGDMNLPEAVGSSGASTISITRDDASVAATEDVGDSESVCL